MNLLRGALPRATAAAVMCAAAAALVCGCGQARAEAAGPGLTPPPGDLSAERACELVVAGQSPGFFTGIDQVHLVLTTYAKGEPIESGGDVSTGMPPGTLVWVVEVHAKAINWNHSMPSSPAASTAQRYTDFSVVLNARTGQGTDAGECNCWPLPLWRVGTVVSLPARC